MSLGFLTIISIRWLLFSVSSGEIGVQLWRNKKKSGTLEDGVDPRLNPASTWTVSVLLCCLWPLLAALSHGGGGRSAAFFLPCLDGFDHAHARGHLVLEEEVVGTWFAFFPFDSFLPHLGDCGFMLLHSVHLRFHAALEFPCQRGLCLL